MYILLSIYNMHTNIYQYTRAPRRFKTAVICDMLSRVCHIAGGLGGVLSRIRTELMKAVYVDYKEGQSPFA